MTDELTVKTGIHMKIALVFPPISIVPGAPPCGLSALSSFLKKRNVNVKVFDLNIELYEFILENWDEIKDTIRDYFLNRQKNEMLSDEKNKRLKFLCEITIPLISKVRKQRDSTVLLRSVQDLANEYFFDEIFETSSFIDNHLVADYAELMQQVRKKARDPILGRFIKTFEWDFPNIFAFSLLTEQQFPYSMLIAQVLREKSPGSRIILGGAYITEIYPYFLENKSIFSIVDYLVRYEGESALLGILHSERDKTFLRHPNVITAKTDGTMEPVFLEDIQRENDQDFSGYNLDLYKKYGDIALPLYSSKGCTWRKCAFCSLNQIQKYRQMDTDCLVKKINKCIRETGITTFVIVDEDIYPRRLKELSQKIQTSCPGTIRWLIQTRFYPELDAELLKLAHASGCINMEFGLESASERTLARINKGISLDTVRRILSDCEQVGLHVILNCMIGFPGEDESDVATLVSFLDEIQSRHPDLVFSCNTQTVKIYQNADFGKNPEKYHIEGLKKVPLSPIRAWTIPPWIPAFYQDFKNHIILCQKNYQVIRNELKNSAMDEWIDEDPCLGLSSNWVLLESGNGIPDTAKTRYFTHYLIRVFHNRYQVLKITPPVAALADMLIDKKIRLSRVKQKFLEIYAGYPEKEVLFTLGDSLLKLNKAGRIFFSDT